MSAVEVSAHMSRPLFPGGAGAAHVLVLSKAIVRGETVGQLRDRSLAGYPGGRKTPPSLHFRTPRIRLKRGHYFENLNNNRR